jgi:DNA-binding transcriptional LysR family regulator
MSGMNKNERSIRGIDSDLLRTFVAVAEQASITDAGRRLGRTQSAVSVQIRKLEQALSVDLFERKARGMALNDAGRLLLPQAAKVLGELDRIGDLFATPLVGRVRVGIPDDYGSDVLERILAGFGARHAEVEISMRYGISAQYPEALDKGELDLAVYAADAPGPSGTVLFTEHTVWAAREDWISPVPDPVPLALFDRTCWWRDAAIAALSNAGLRHRIAVSSESVSGVKAAVRTGLAVAMLARTALEPGMRELGIRDGFPILPPSTLVLAQNPRSDSEPVREMARVIRDGFLQMNH